MSIKDGEDLHLGHEGMLTINEVFRRNVKTDPKKPFLGTREKKVNAEGNAEFGQY